MKLFLQMEFQWLLPFVHDGVPDIVWRMDWATMGLHESWEECGKCALLRAMNILPISGEFNMLQGSSVHSGALLFVVCIHFRETTPAWYMECRLHVSTCSECHHQILLLECENEVCVSILAYLNCSYINDSPSAHITFKNVRTWKIVKHTCYFEHKIPSNLRYIQFLNKKFWKN
jgi:hypothetical protein